MRVEKPQFFNRRPWWHGTGPYFLLILTILALSLAINTTLKNEYKALLQEQREDVARLQLEVENLQHQKEILEETLLRRIQEVNDLIYKFDSMRPDVTVTDEELELLERLVTAEAQGESYEGQLAVANVVIDRTLSPAFPDTIKAVILQPGQFCPVAKGIINTITPSDTARQAVADALKGHRIIEENALYFYNPRIVSRGHWIRTRQTVTDIGNHRFAL